MCKGLHSFAYNYSSSHQNTEIMAIIIIIDECIYTSNYIDLQVLLNCLIYNYGYFIHGQRQLQVLLCIR